MNLPAHVDLVRKLKAQIGGGPALGVDVGKVPASIYTSADRFERERSALFARLPSLVAHESELAEAGACLKVDVAGAPLLLVRGDDGKIRAFRNACRHRGTELVAEDDPCKRKPFVCPYHGWTYDLRGGLIHVPHARSFRGEEASRTQLAGAYVEVRHGFVWASLAPIDPSFLAPIEDDLRFMDAPSHVLYRRSRRDVRGNWKLIVDAFVDGYHIRRLHKDSVARFFLDAVVEAEEAGPHIRAATARRALVEATAPLESAELRLLATPSYLVFPSTILIVHPDFLSVLTSTPLSAALTRFEHRMLVPRAQHEGSREEHWEKSFALIDEGVFGREDLRIVEAVQRGIASGANDTLLFGELERAALWFHANVDRVLASAT
jgi:phenylpropionate dioxygenase-like ring-hydroxylating dioxygenase large terminal subunit